MNRRDLLSLPAVGVAAMAAQPKATTTPTLMKVGCQSGPSDDRRLQFFKRHGVDNICGQVDAPEGRGYWTVDDLSRLRDRCGRHGVKLEMVWEPFLRSQSVDKTSRPAIMLGKSPDRDKDIETFQNYVRDCAKVGIPAIKYNLTILGKPRTGSSPGRGGSRYSTFRLKDAGDKAKALTKAGRVTADIYWERITYFLERVVPVAEEYKIRLACHPQDPHVPFGYAGVDAVLGTVDGLKKFVAIKESPYHGLNFCQGTVCEMLDDPGKEIFDVIHYFGSRKKIFNVHFRNIRGGRNDFQETFPDEGDIDMWKALQVYREVGYPYLLMPDHVPEHPDDDREEQAFAFCYGYIRALLQAAG